LLRDSFKRRTLARFIPRYSFSDWFCCGAICYPLFRHFRNRTGYFKPQPYAFGVAIVAVVLSIGINAAINLGTAALQQAPQ
jgi:hypothetical protein